MKAPDNAKANAALAACDLVRSGMKLGLGTGSTAKLVIEELGRRLTEGRVRDLRAAPTSEATAALARSAGIPLLDLDDLAPLDLTIDGADEVDSSWNLIKGAGGALLREKIVAQASLQACIAVDESKLVARLGEKVPLPIEVIRMGWKTQVEFLRSLGGAAVLREQYGAPVMTDEGNYLLDVRFEHAHGLAALRDPLTLQTRLLARGGIVETGLFLGLTHILVVGRGDGATVERKTE